MYRFKRIVWDIMFKNDLNFIQNNYTPILHEKRIAELETLIKDLESKLELLTSEYTSEKEFLNTEIARLQNQIKLLKGEEIQVVKPDWLVYGAVISPKVLVSSKSGDELIKLHPCDIYTSSNLIRKIVLVNNWKELYLKNKELCAYKIWEYVITRLTYEYDKGEDWRFSTLTHEKRSGDCEDGTILFLDLARESGFKANEVFNVCGIVKTGSGSFGHSFPIVNYGSGWYIYETTLDFVPDKPMLFKGSNYDGSYGCANWLFSGVIDNDSYQV